ncbi:Ig-like domain-containing protein [Candidatus Palauibacter sp.]|uniref:Ig-like domain-containing protein n=1 Tax=Candidatus Palauibacter sp. TaxID=3101350 RepID=UPI003B5BDDC8
MTVEAANRAPEAVGAIPAQTITAGQTATVDVSSFFSDPDGDDLAYAAESSNTAAATVGMEGSSLTVTAVAAGTATVTVTASDPDGLTAAQSAEVTVEAANRAPEAVGTIPAQTITAGQTATVDVSSFFSDPDGDDLAYAAESSNTAAATVGMEGSSLTVTAVAAGTATVTVTASDPDGLSAAQSAEVTVEAANRAPEAVGAIPAQTMTAGQTATVDVSAFFSDPDGDDLAYAAESSNTDAVAVGMSGSSLTVTAVAAGTATVTVTASDPDGLTAAQSAEVTVEAANRAPEAVGTIPAQTITAGQTATVDVSPFFGDPDGDDLAYAAESSNTDAVAVGISGSSLTVTAVAAGTATVTVTASDPDGLTATQSAEVTVEAANRAPEAVGTIPAQTITAGQTATVDVSSFFSDPDGDDLTYAAESSNTAAATVGMEGSSLTVTAVAAGTATVTVTASDPDGLTAAQSAEVTVEAANRAPEALGTIPAQTVKQFDAVTVNMFWFFRDPDDDELTYAAESSNTAAVPVSMEGSVLTLTAVAAGTATVTVTASDPDGLTATQNVEVIAEEGGGFRDHFDTAASLDDWDLFRSTAEVFDGVLYVTPDGTGKIGSADRVFDAPVTDWKVGVSMARGTAGEGVVAWFVMAHPRFLFWRLAIGPFGEYNYVLHVFDLAVNDYILITNLSGYSDEINDDVNEFTEMTLLHRNGQFALLAGGVELFRLNSANQTFKGADLDHMLESVETIWLGAVSEGTASFDWAYASGTEIGASAANPAGPPPMGASPRLPEGAKQARPGNRTDTIRPGKGR